MHSRPVCLRAFVTQEVQVWDRPSGGFDGEWTTSRPAPLLGRSHTSIAGGGRRETSFHTVLTLTRLRDASCERDANRNSGLITQTTTAFNVQVNCKCPITIVSAWLDAVWCSVVSWSTAEPQWRSLSYPLAAPVFIIFGHCTAVMRFWRPLRWSPRRSLNYTKEYVNLTKSENPLILLKCFYCEIKRPFG